MFTAAFKAPHSISWKARKVHGEIKMSEDLAAAKLMLTANEAAAPGPGQDVPALSGPPAQGKTNHRVPAASPVPGAPLRASLSSIAIPVKQIKTHFKGTKSLV